MKNLNLLSRTEMKEVKGGVPLASYCGEGQVLAECRVEYTVWVNGGGYWSENWGYISFPDYPETHSSWIGGCMPEGEYYSNQANCRLMGKGGPYPV